MLTALEQANRSLSVADALRLPVLQRGLPEVVAGEENLDRRIRWVHAGEVPDIASLLSGGELLLTTGIGLSRSEVERRRYIARLAERDLAALVVELGPRLPEVPDGMRCEAEAFGMPLVALHRVVRFIDVTEAVHTELINQRYARLQEGEAVSQSLVDGMLAGQSLSEVLQSLSEIVGNPVFVEGIAGDLLFHAGDQDDLDAWRVSKDAPTAGVEARIPIGSNRESGRLVMLPTRRPVEEGDSLALNHAATIVALAFLRARSEEELSLRERGDLLADLLEGGMAGDDASRQAALMGYSFAGLSLLPVAVEFAISPTPAAWTAFVNDVQKEMELNAVPLLAGGYPKDRRLLMLAGLTSSLRREEVADRISAALRAALRRRRLNMEPTAAVGAPTDWEGAGPALRLALESARAAAPLPARDWHDVSRLEVERLLRGVGEDVDLGAFVERTLGPLLAHDRERKVALLPTLKALCDNGGRKSEAARELHLNRQALYHRLDRIEALGIELEDADQLLTLQLAIKALAYVP